MSEYTAEQYEAEAALAEIRGDGSITADMLRQAAQMVRAKDMREPVTDEEAAKEALALLEQLDPQHGITTQLRTALEAFQANRVQVKGAPFGGLHVSGDSCEWEQEKGAQGEAVAYFAADPANDEFATFKSLDEAKEMAQIYLDDAADDASESGWADEPPQICYGVVLSDCEEVPGSRRTTDSEEDGLYASVNFGEMVDYRLAQPAYTAPRAAVPDGIVGILDELKAHAMYSRDRFSISTQARVSCEDMIALADRGIAMLTAAPSADAKEVG